MGITGLLPLLKSIQRPTKLGKISGDVFGVDGYSWLHRGAHSCALELAQGKPARQYIDFFMSRVKMMQHFNKTPYVVFDGDFLPSKAGTEGSRSQRREEAKKLGLELLKAGKPSQAQDTLKKAIDVTPEMAREVIAALKRAQIPYVVAPYEADAQLVYLERHGFTDGTVTEDSDLLVFGAKRLITKLDKYGQCIEINRRDFNACREVSFVGWDDGLFRHMAIMSGCDYIDGIPNVGLKTAHRLLRKHKSVDRVVQTLQFEGKHRIPPDYLTQFRRAEQTFLYQWVFCPDKKKLVNLTPPPPDLDPSELPFIGSFIEPELARKIADGTRSPTTKEEFTPSKLHPKKYLRYSPKSKKRKASIASDSNTSQTKGTRETPKKGIDAYFKDHSRIPLGEMDANCFHVDPNRANGEDTQPIVFPLPRPYIEGTALPDPGPSRLYINGDRSPSHTLRRRTEPVSNLLGDGGRSLTSLRRKSTGLGGGSFRGDRSVSGMNSQPLKKPRLCDSGDVALGLSPGKEKSRFFSPSGSQPRKAAGGQGYLMSDDSVEEALRELPDIDGWPKQSDRRRTIDVFEGAHLQLDELDAPVTSNDDKQAVLSGTSEPVQGPLGITIPDTPPKSTLSRFTFSNTKLIRGQSSTRSSILSTTPSSGLSRRASTARTTPATTPRLTPLQQLGRKSLSQAQESPTLPFVGQRGPKRSSLSRLSLDSIPINPVFASLQPTGVVEPGVSDGPMGSEDLLVPGSETDEVEAVPEPETGNLVGKRTGFRTMDLSQYMHT
ncbi:hypothetical protein F4777DRAFT_567547 [Nemania sp. FL0916]|nr:hypothetical protein F4777DRAFT_567547 [Nemania sp. FL0916]